MVLQFTQGLLRGCTAYDSPLTLAILLCLLWWIKNLEHVPSLGVFIVIRISLGYHAALNSPCLPMVSASRAERVTGLQPRTPARAF